jgi:hypothetical protein
MWFHLKRRLQTEMWSCANYWQQNTNNRYFGWRRENCYLGGDGGRGSGYSTNSSDVPHNINGGETRGVFSMWKSSTEQWHGRIMIKYNTVLQFCIYLILMAQGSKIYVFNSCIAVMVAHCGEEEKMARQCKSTFYGRTVDTVPHSKYLPKCSCNHCPPHLLPYLSSLLMRNP